MTIPHEPRTSSRSRRNVRRAVDAVLVAAFVTAIVAPAIDAFVRDDAARGPARELRRASEEPALPASMQELLRFPAAYEAHFSDTFGLRDRLMHLNSLEKHQVFGTAPSKAIVVGDHGWIFWGGDRSPEVFRGVAPLSAEELFGWQHEIEERARKLQEHGCRYVWIIAPNKETIYPERMPAGLRPVGPTRFEQFVSWMKERSKVDVLDLRPVLLEEKEHDSGPLDAVYSPYGTHWTGRGVLAVVREIVEHLAKEHPGVIPLAREDIQILPMPVGEDTLAGILYLNGVLTTPDLLAYPRDEGRVELIEKREEAPARTVTRARGAGLLPHTVMFHDSFGPFVSHLLAANCEILETHGDHFDARVVDPARTRIVIEMYVERVLVTKTPEALTPPQSSEATERFRAMPNVLFDLESTPGGVVPIDSMPAEQVEIDGKPAWSFVMRAARQGLSLPSVRLPGSGEVCAWIEIESPEAGLFDLLWKRASESEFKRSDRATIALEAGRSSRLMWLPPLGGESVLMLRPRAFDKTFTLRAFSVRSTKAP